MGKFFLVRLAALLASALILSFVVFALAHVRPNLEKLAKSEANARMSDEEVQSWLHDRGYLEPLVSQYGMWLGVLPRDAKSTSCPNAPASKATSYCGVLQGYWGFSTQFERPAREIIAEKIVLSGRLMFWVFLIMIPASLFFGVLMGIRPGSRLDRFLSVPITFAASMPEYITGMILITLLASSQFGLSPILHTLGLIETPTLFKGTSTTAMTHPDFWNFALPVLTLALFGGGYIARMTRASVTGIMEKNYILGARLRGIPFGRTVTRHVLRNAMIVPFTVIMLQIPWLITGAVVVEVLFNYKGLGWLLLESARNNDIDLLIGVSVISTMIVLISQILADLTYTWLDPRIRVGA